jgi:putative transposase
MSFLTTRTASGNGRRHGGPQAQHPFEREPHTRGAPSKFERKALVDACCYVLRTGCAWRLPRDFPPWTTVYKAFVHWANMGLFESMHDRLRKHWRQRLGRHQGPTGAVLDSQSNRSSPQSGEAGFDAGKKAKGRKRHLVVETLGVVLAVTVTAASVQDRDGAPAVTAQACDNPPALQKLWVDGAYAQPMASMSRSYAIRATATPMSSAARAPRRTGLLSFSKASSSCPYAGSSSAPTPGTNWRRPVMHHDRRADISRAWVWHRGCLPARITPHSLHLIYSTPSKGGRCSGFS